MKHTIYLLTIVLTIASTTATVAQTAPLTSEQRTEVLTAIAAAQKPKTGETLNYTFVQTKHSPLLADDAVSKGRMTLASDHTMQWQYTEPQAFTLVVKGDSIYTVKDGQHNSLSGVGGKMAHGLAQMMMQMTDGASLSDGKLFETTLTEEGGTYRAILLPKRRDMKRMMQHAEFTFDRKTLRIKRVRLIEKNDSYTNIDFSLQ